MTARLAKSFLGALALSVCLSTPASAVSIEIVYETDIASVSVPFLDWLGLDPNPTVGDPLSVTLRMDDLTRLTPDSHPASFDPDFRSDAVTIEMSFAGYELIQPTPISGFVNVIHWSDYDQIVFSTIDNLEAFYIAGHTIPAPYHYVNLPTLSVTLDLGGPLDDDVIPADLPPIDAARAAVALGNEVAIDPTLQPYLLNMSASSGSINYTVVPEPSTGALLGLGVILTASRRRLSRRSPNPR